MVLMASAIENDCLMSEYGVAAENVVRINVVASRRDHVLELAYPAGNLLGRLIMASAPNLHTALGRDGPNPTLLATQLGNACQIDVAWAFDHGDYLRRHLARPPCRRRRQCPPDQPSRWVQWVNGSRLGPRLMPRGR
jgi:hypothetical protein